MSIRKNLSEKKKSKTAVPITNKELKSKYPIYDIPRQRQIRERLRKKRTRLA